MSCERSVSVHTCHGHGAHVPWPWCHWHVHGAVRVTGISWGSVCNLTYTYSGLIPGPIRQRYLVLFLGS